MISNEEHTDNLSKVLKSMLMKNSGLDPLNTFHVFVFYCNKNQKLKEILMRYI